MPTSPSSVRNLAKKMTACGTRIPARSTSRSGSFMNPQRPLKIGPGNEVQPVERRANTAHNVGAPPFGGQPFEEFPHGGAGFFSVVERSRLGMQLFGNFDGIVDSRDFMIHLVFPSKLLRVCGSGLGRRFQSGRGGWRR